VSTTVPAAMLAVVTLAGARDRRMRPPRWRGTAQYLVALTGLVRDVFYILFEE
jgi:hypothetical protein